jgi:ankyrin repeat protein
MTIVGQLTHYFFGPAIHKAAFQGDLKGLKTQIDSGTNPDLRDSTGITPLMLAAQKRHNEIVEYLISQGADVNAKTTTGFTALFHSCIQGDDELAKILIGSGADVNAREDGITPLMIAAFKGHLKMVKLLLENGADSKATDNTGKLTALSMAKGESRQQILELIDRHLNK